MNERRREQNESWETNGRRDERDRGKGEATGKSKGTKGEFGKQAQAARANEGRGKGKTKSDLLDRLYQFCRQQPGTSSGCGLCAPTAEELLFLMDLLRAFLKESRRVRALTRPLLGCSWPSSRSASLLVSLAA